MDRGLFVGLKTHLIISHRISYGGDGQLYYTPTQYIVSIYIHCKRTYKQKGRTCVQREFHAEYQTIDRVHVEVLDVISPDILDVSD